MEKEIEEILKKDRESIEKIKELEQKDAAGLRACLSTSVVAEIRKNVAAYNDLLEFRTRYDRDKAAAALNKYVGKYYKGKMYNAATIYRYYKVLSNQSVDGCHVIVLTFPENIIYFGYNCPELIEIKQLDIKELEEENKNFKEIREEDFSIALYKFVAQIENFKLLK